MPGHTGVNAQNGAEQPVWDPGSNRFYLSIPQIGGPPGGPSAGQPVPDGAVIRINPFTATADQYERQEVIGPHQIEGGRIWFGNGYYDGEGMRGVGAFGYFDTTTREYTLFSPPEVARYEISAVLVEPERVWIALDRFGEDISRSPGGFVRWNRITHEIQKYPLEFVVDSIRIDGDSLRLETRDGYALFRNGEFRRFLTNGRPIAKFPPPPTHN